MSVLSMHLSSTFWHRMTFLCRTALVRTDFVGRGNSCKFCVDNCRATTRPLIGGRSEYSSTRWLRVTRRSLLINQYRSMRRLYLARYRVPVQYSSRHVVTSFFHQKYGSKCWHQLTIIDSILIPFISASVGVLTVSATAVEHQFRSTKLIDAGPG